MISRTRASSPNLNVFDNLASRSARTSAPGGARAPHRAHEAARRGLRGARDMIRTTSRVHDAASGLARAIATDPKLMMYDEPFAGSTRSRSTISAT